jgi:hypothetical protein
MMDNEHSTLNLFGNHNEHELYLVKNNFDEFEISEKKIIKIISHFIDFLKQWNQMLSIF